jgi:hypothetical protein
MQPQLTCRDLAAVPTTTIAATIAQLESVYALASRLLPGVRLNLSKTGLSLSLGVPGCTYKLHTNGQTRTTLS